MRRTATSAKGTARADGPGPGSTLIYGDEPTSLLAVAAALAARGQTAFAWALAPKSVPAVDPRLLQAIRARFRGVEPIPLDDRELVAVLDDVDSVARAVDPSSLSSWEREQIVQFLALPPVLQRLAARAVTDDGTSAVVIHGLETLPYAVVEAVFGRPRLHALLADLGVLLFVTYRGEPPAPFRQAFGDRLRVDGVNGLSRPEAWVLVDEENPSSGVPRITLPLAQFWEEEGLDEALLPPPNG